MRRGAGWLTGPPQGLVGSLAPRAVLPSPWAQAYKRGRDWEFLFKQRALVPCFLDALRVSWCEYESRAFAPSTIPHPIECWGAGLVPCPLCSW